MKITSLYDKYFQKSKIFLYPLLDIKRGTSVVPHETYLSWKDNISSEDMKLVTLYKTREDTMYKNFIEKNSGNALYVNSYLFPVNHFNNYAKILDVDVSMLKNVGELCDKPDLKRETLLLEKANLENIDNSKINC